MSSSISLRRSPKPGAFTAATLIVPCNLLTTNASASSSVSSAMINSGSTRFGDLFEQRQEVIH